MGYQSTVGDAETAFVKAIAPSEVNRLRYEEWIHTNRIFVNEHSDNRLGYIHIRHFGTGALATIKRQLDAEIRRRDGIVIDIRYNGGGWASGEVAALLARRVTHRSTFRNRVEAANATIHGVTVIHKPCVLLQNEQCLSDSENFSEAFRCLGIGKIVGMRTAAWNVGARQFRTSHGYSIGLPAWKAISAVGKDMDKVSRKPDIEVDHLLGESLEGRDQQLEMCVRILLESLRN